MLSSGILWNMPLPLVFPSTHEPLGIHVSTRKQYIGHNYLIYPTDVSGKK